MNKNEYFKKIPKVDVLLAEEKVQSLCEEYGRSIVVECIREETENLRNLISAGAEADISGVLDNFFEHLEEKVLSAAELPLRRVLNATGVILHTNLGRAPLGRAQMEKALEILCGYSNLEFDLETGKRGRRHAHYAETIAKVTGAESAVAVNNNAAAVTLMLSALAKGKEVLVSRGELVEIGGHFRIPEVIEQSGATLREVGTTNRTRISDYEKAVTEETGALLKVHTSNYKVVGFTEEASVEELAALGKKYHLPVLVDLGSGVLVNLEKYGIAHEPTVQENLKKGADLVSFSGDKLLGGPQAGIAAGKKAYICAMEKDPLMRSFRPDKFTIAALTATFREYLDEKNAEQKIPVLRMLSRKTEELKEQAEKLLEELQKTDIAKADIQITLRAEASLSVVGGGSLPMEKLPGYALTIRPQKMSCERMAEKLRHLDIPVIAHIKDNKIWLEMRTIMPEELPELKKELKIFLADVCGNRTHPGRD